MADVGCFLARNAAGFGVVRIEQSDVHDHRGHEASAIAVFRLARILAGKSTLAPRFGYRILLLSASPSFEPAPLQEQRAGKRPSKSSASQNAPQADHELNDSRITMFCTGRN